MSRPKMHRCLRFQPTTLYFKPRGVPINQLQEIILLSDEIEAIKLYHTDGLDQVQASKKMNISQPTFTRVHNKAVKKIVDALVTGKAIRIEQSKPCYGLHNS